MIFNSSSEDEQMSNESSSPSTSIQPNMVMEGWGDSGQNQVTNHEGSIELSPIYAGSDAFQGEILSISDAEEAEPRNNGTPGGSSSFSITATNNENLRKPSPQPFVFEPLENFEEKASFELPSKTRLKIKIKRLKIVGEWRWTDGKGDNCGICRTSFEACCVDCRFPGDDCPLVNLQTFT
ncbi:RING-type domain-containing protein [Meloidogyne graminicola]|uniref:RING-type domain-containing protein n=1 Tax=Meloidogyne graminicola TaxID=189291 RepID=A0A8S9ZYY6_9BILA|nr:RING-type domain-containing protein [Meloidogyne graminicola]